MAQPQVRLGQVRRGTAQHLVLLLQQPVTPTKVFHLLGLGFGHTGTVPVLDIGPVEPVPQARLGDPEVSSHLRDRSIATTGDRDDVLPKLLGVGSWHGDILPAGNSRPRRSGVNRTFSSP
jgi:hypothetical protein